MVITVDAFTENPENIVDLDESSPRSLNSEEAAEAVATATRPRKSSLTVAAAYRDDDDEEDEVSEQEEVPEVTEAPMRSEPAVSEESTSESAKPVTPKARQKGNGSLCSDSLNDFSEMCSEPLEDFQEPATSVEGSDASFKPEDSIEYSEAGPKTSPVGTTAEKTQGEENQKSSKTAPAGAPMTRDKSSSIESL